MNLKYLKIYPIFKHVWTEGETGVREYELVNVFNNPKNAIDYVSGYYETNTSSSFFFGGTMDIDVLILTTDNVPFSHFKWIENMESWVSSCDKGIFKWFKSITKHQCSEWLVRKGYSESELEFVELENFGDMFISTPIPNYEYF